MQQDHAARIYETAILDLGRALRTYSLYGSSHPSTKENISSLWKTLSGIFRTDDHFELAVEEDKILVSGKAVEEKNPVFKVVLTLMNRLDVLSLSFQQAMSFEELEAFIRSAGEMGSQKINAASFEAVLRSRSVTHIDVNTAVYTKVGKHQAPEAAAQDLRRAPGSTEEAGDLLAKFESLEGTEKARFLARTLRSAQTLGRVVQEALRPDHAEAARRFFDEGCRVFIQKASRAGADQISVLKSFAKFKRAAHEELCDKPELAPLQDILEQSYDTLRAQIFASQFLQSGRSRETLQQVAEHWFSSPQEIWRLVPQIRRILSEKGAKAVTLSEIFETFGKAHPLSVSGLASRIEKVLDRLMPDTTDKAEAETAILDAVAHFVTSEVQKEIKALQEENSRLDGVKRRMEGIFEAVSDGLVVADEHGKILFVNPAARVLLGLAQDAPLEGLVVEKLMPGQVVAMSKGNLEKVAGGSWEIQVKGDMVSRKTLMENMGLIRDEKGAITGSIFTLSDVTRQRSLIENRAEVFSRIVYDMRESLALLRQSVSLIGGELGKTADEDQKKILQMSERGIDRLNESLTRLYEPAKIDARPKTMLRQWVDLRTLVHQTLSGMDGWISAKTLKIEISSPEEEILLALNLDHFLDLLHTVIAYCIRITHASGSILIQTAFVTGNARRLQISFKSLDPANEPDEAASTALRRAVNETLLLELFKAVGVRLPAALACLKDDDITLRSADGALHMTLPVS